jgi:hypothetical protein
MNAQSDMSGVIIPKSDQINADDLVAGPMTITINDVQIRGGQEQPVSIFFDGSEKAFRPCKSMSRCLVLAWGPDASKYIGRSLTLYRDDKVKWGGLEVGGIRISHMSDLDGPKTMMLTATKGSRKPHKVSALAASKPAAPAAQPKADESIDWIAWFENFKNAIPQQSALRSLNAWRAPEGIPEAMLKDAREIIDQRIADLSPPAPSDGFNEPHPAQAKADAITTELRAQNAAIDLNSVWARHRDDISAMPDELIVALEVEMNECKARVQAAHDKAKKSERKVEA